MSALSGSPAPFSGRRDASAPVPAALAWRTIHDPPRTGGRNMALDHALADSLLPGEGVVRFYAWSAPTVSFGRNEPSTGRYDQEAAAAAGIDFVRRPTGGRSVLHADEVTYCVVAPLRALGGARAAYARINGGLVAGLGRLGVPARLSRDGSALPPDAGPCFRAPAEGEVMLDGGKLVGSAQARIGSHLLQHGSLLLSGDQRRLAELRGEAPDTVPPATLTRALPSIDRAAVHEALAFGLALALGGTWRKGGYSPTEQEAANRLERERYATDAWTWRR